jgi:pimeloyl-ACP methyl ester carboxylesterase
VAVAGTADDDGSLTLVCLHYLGGSGREFAGVAQQLGAAFSVMPLDLPGFGSARATLGYTVVEMAQSIRQAIHQLKPRRWALLGHSMGAKVACAIARDLEDGAGSFAAPTSLILIAGSPPAPEPMQDDKRNTMLSWFHGDEATSLAEARLYVRQNVSDPLPDDAADQATDDVLRMSLPAWRGVAHGRQSGELVYPHRVAADTGAAQRGRGGRESRSRRTTRCHGAALQQFQAGGTGGRQAFATA